MRFSLFSLVLTAFVGLLLVGACSSPPTLRTQSLSQAPSVDGTLSEWDGGLTRVGDRSVSMSAAPTDSLLYLAVVISDQSLVRSVAEKGLVVWVDPTGKQLWGAVSDCSSGAAGSPEDGRRSCARGLWAFRYA